ncbi:MAG: hypothetical protein AAF998_19290 [Bacteroidota bacterium]
MKKIQFGFAALALALGMMVTGCSDPCDDVNCLNGSECVEGDCVCLTGYEGADCGTAINAKFDGTFNMTAENCSVSGPGNVPYSISITASSTDPSTIVVTGLYEEAGAVATALVGTGGTDFTITRADFSNFAAEIDGSGTIDGTGNSIQINYTIYDDATGDVLEICTGTITRL